MQKHQYIIVTEHFEPEIGATSQLITELVDRLVADEIKVTVLTYAQSSIAKPHIVRLSPSSPPSSTGLFGKAFKGINFIIASILWISCHRPSKASRILVVSNPPFVGIVGLFAWLTFKLPYIFLLQDVFPRSAVLSGILPARGPLTHAWALFIKLVIAYSSKTIVLSDSMYSRVAKDFGSKHKLFIIPNWSVLKPSSPLATTSHEGTTGSRSSFQVQYSGNYGRLHDILTILESSRILLNKRTDIHFTFIGGGPKLNQILKYKKELCLANISTKPYQPTESAFASISSCDVSIISIIPGAQDTIAPCKLYGIIAAGKPVILIARPECYIAKLISKYECGVVVEPGEPQELSDVLEYLLSSPAACATMGRNSLRLYNSKYTFDIAYQSYKSILEF